jgi:hypothetical protein
MTAIYKIFPVELGNCCQAMLPQWTKASVIEIAQH